jgi:glycosyltransferase involved in cell wall biosynthesis
MQSRNKVTALVPAYQSAEFIQKTLDSLSLQTQDDFNIIISVDLCEDETYGICLQHASQDPRFQVIKQNERLGYVGNCNFLLDQTDSEYVLFAFHDDILEGSYVEKLCEVLDKKPNVIMAFSDILLTPYEGKTTTIKYRVLNGIKSNVMRGMIMLSQKGNWWIPNRGVFRLEKIKGINGYKRHSSGEYSCDWPWLFHMSLLGQFHAIPESLCHKFYKKNSLSRLWGSTPKQWHDVSVSCLRELWASPILLYKKVFLSLPLLIKVLKLWIILIIQIFIPSFKK